MARQTSPRAGAALLVPGAKGEFEKVSGGGDYVVAGTLDIRVEKRKDEIVVTLPANLLADTKTVRIEWIDAYRG